MRIIGGKYKSRRIPVSSNLKARPTTDFAKENLFNILTNRVYWEETVALDLFSGTGSIAFELISRGCPSVTGVEKNQNHYGFICKVQQMLEAKELHLVKTDAFKYLQSVTTKFDLIFADPPYDLPNADIIPTIIFERQLLNLDGIFIMEHSKEYNFASHPLFIEERKYGSVHFSLFENKMKE